MCLSATTPVVLPPIIISDILQRVNKKLSTPEVPSPGRSPICVGLPYNPNDFQITVVITTPMHAGAWSKNLCALFNVVRYPNDVSYSRLRVISATDNS